jgi:hypothetical protein
MVTGTSRFPSLLLPDVQEVYDCVEAVRYLHIAPHSVVFAQVQGLDPLECFSQLDTLLTSSRANACTMSLRTYRHDLRQCGLLSLTLRRLTLPVIGRL